MRATRTLRDDHTKSSEQVDMRRVKDDHDIGRIVGLTTPLVMKAGRLIGPCPLHEGRGNSLVVDPATQTFSCEACLEGGDVVDFVRLHAGCSQIAACEWLMGSHRTCPPSERPHVRVAAGRRALAVGNARAIWRDALPIVDTPAERHVRSLGLNPARRVGLRFAHTPVSFDAKTSRPGLLRPAIVAACQDVEGAIVGIHRTFLDGEGSPTLIEGASVDIGQVQGTALRHGPESATIILAGELAEGIAVMGIVPEATVWTALSPGDLAETVLPPATRMLWLAGRGDRTDATELARARVTFMLKGLRVGIIRPSADRATFVDALAGTRAA